MAKSSATEEITEFGWWVEIVAATPACTYYFGPFTTYQEAQSAQPGYIKDLEQEGAKEIIPKIKQCLTWKMNDETVF